MRTLLVLASTLAVSLVPGIFLTQAHASGSYTVTAKVSATSINFGQQVTMSGKVSPNAAGTKIRIQRSHDDQDYVGFETVHTATIRSDGTFSKTFAPSIGTYKWRAYKMYGQGRTGGASTPIAIHAYTWYQLANSSWVHVLSDDTGGPGRFGPITVAGTPFTSYWESKADATGRTRWYLQRSCRRFIGTVGLDDARSDPGAFGRVRVEGSPALLLDKSMNGSTKLAVDVSFDAGENSWFTISATRLYPDKATAVVVANPKVQCAFPHNEDELD
ncbi:hypothetical protein ASE12_10925 [Aeromicrobium sp. Root236]|uniref:hypothetical protein n=1 Tax=Aeromicrobium sp. Root236 TaxID=1736498 RepID=UPI0007011A0D|nr:hypothetical protein [Aeromicrobium sp. Root236]KRC65231.1 hypothetical protein ASE12_10925 [Aeromicrobium sp. Root236]